MWSEWVENGLIEIPEFGTQAMWDAMTEEALAAEPFAMERKFDRIEAYRDGSMTSPQRGRAHEGGPAMRAFSHSRELIYLAREATGMSTLIPARFGYKYYRRGDFMGIHRDAVRCNITFSFSLTDNLGNMTWAPSLRRESNDNLVAAAKKEGIFPAWGESMPVLHRCPKGFDGYNIPHWRTPFEHDFGILGTVCFFNLAGDPG